MKTLVEKVSAYHYVSRILGPYRALKIVLEDRDILALAATLKELVSTTSWQNED